MTNKYPVIYIDGFVYMVEPEVKVGDVAMSWYPSCFGKMAKIIADQNNKACPHWVVEYLDQPGKEYYWEKSGTDVILASNNSSLGLPLIDLKENTDELFKQATKAIGISFDSVSSYRELCRKFMDYGYKANEKKYSEEDMLKAIQYGKTIEDNDMLLYGKGYTAFMESLSPKIKEIEVEMVERCAVERGKCDCSEQDIDCQCTKWEPEIVNNKIVLKKIIYDK